MTFPVVAARTESAITSAAATSNASFAQTTGDFVLIIHGQAATPTLPTIDKGFTRIVTINTDPISFFYKVLDGSEGGFATITHSVNTKACQLAYNIQGSDTAIEPDNSSKSTATSTSPNADNVTPTGGPKDFLWIACFRQAGEEADDDTWCSAAPTNFINLIQKTTGTGGAASTNCQVAAANFASNASSMNPDAFTTAQSLTWIAYVLAVHPAPAGQNPYRNPYAQLLAH